jgi:IclR family acetate operon transcriptional repressor
MAFKTVEMSLKILHWLSQQRGDRGVSEISREFGIDKATVTRHLQTLLAAGFVERDPRSRRYRPGFSLIELGGLLLGNLRLLEVTRPFIIELWQKTGESCQLSILRGVKGAMYIHRLESPNGPGIERLGNYGPLHCSAAGKALLAFLPAESISRVLDGPLLRYTAQTTTDRETLLEELESVRQNGFAVDIRGFRDYLTSLAAPIFALDDKPVAAIGIGGSSHHLDRKQILSLSRELLDTTRRITEMMQYEAVPEAILP